MIMYIGGVANDTEAEGMDRVAIAWTGAQLDLIGELAMMGKKMAVVQMGGGQLDVSHSHPELVLQDHAVTSKS